jgi:hypothetical protein
VLFDVGEGAGVVLGAEELLDLLDERRFGRERGAGDDEGLGIFWFSQCGQLPTHRDCGSVEWVRAYLGILIGEAFEQVVFYNRRTIVERWTEVRNIGARSIRAEDVPFSGFGFQRPANGWLLDSIFEYGRLESWSARRLSRGCKGLANMEQRAVVDSSLWNSNIVPVMTNDAARTSANPQRVAE